MKKLLLSMAVGLLMISCGGEDSNESVKDIKVSDIKDACGCAEATVQVMELIIPHKDKLDKLKSTLGIKFLSFFHSL